MRPSLQQLVGSLLWICGSLFASVVNAADKPPDFVKEIRPLLIARCWQCHGGIQQKGSLRLDSPEAARKGGHLTQNLLDPDVTKNEILKRLRTDDIALRMPKDENPLPPEQIALLERWLAAGAPWPAVVIEQPKEEPPPFWLMPLESLLELQVEHLTPAIGMLLVFMLFIIVLEQGRKRGAAPNSSWQWRKLHNCAEKIGYGGYWALALLCVVFALVLQLRLVTQDLVKAREEKMTAQREAAKRYSGSNNPSNSRIATSTQQAHRPMHPPRLGGVYYRGNDERNPALYNGGFYRTAVMEIQLANADRKPLAWNDELPITAACQVHLTIRRAPHATLSLFTPELMNRVFLSHSSPEKQLPDVATDLVPLSVVTPNEVWEAYYPLPPFFAGLRNTGIIYLQQGKFENGKISGAAHFAIGYDLLIEDGKISPTSELWMGAVMLPANAIPLSPESITLYEWLDFRPIPEIVGGNTSDPKLLGVEQYLGPQGKKTEDTTQEPAAEEKSRETNLPK